MAKIQLGNIVTDIRGRQNGTVYARNRYTNYQRNKTNPVNPQSSKQTQIRSLFSAIAQAWRALTDDQRSSWNDLAAQLNPKNVFGNNFKYTGQNVFMMANTTAQNAGLTARTTAPPTPPDYPTMEVADDAIIPVVTANEFVTNITFPATGTPNVVPAGTIVKLEATPPVSASLSEGTIRNLFRVYYYAPATTALAPSVDTGAEYVANFRSLVAGDVGSRIWFRISMIDVTSGLQNGQGVIISGLIEA